MFTSATLTDLARYPSNVFTPATLTDLAWYPSNVFTSATLTDLTWYPSNVFTPATLTDLVWYPSTPRVHISNTNWLGQISSTPRVHISNTYWLGQISQYTTLAKSVFWIFLVAEVRLWNLILRDHLSYVTFKASFLERSPKTGLTVYMVPTLRMKTLVST